MSFDLVRGDSPLILSVPHAGTELPADVFGRLNDTGKLLADTDWHVDRLYHGLMPEATTLVAREHRYLIDLNRDPEGTSLYPGQNTTGLVPEIDFDGNPIWRDGMEPEAEEIAARIETWHAPYHNALRDEIERVLTLHGVAVVYDCHSIRSHIPHLFDGTLPDLNIGTDGGATCSAAVEKAASEAAGSAPGYSSVLNGRFRGGWTVRHHGRPDRNVHAVQMELAQSTYLVHEAAPFTYDDGKAARLGPHLQHVLRSVLAAALETNTEAAATR